MNDRRKETPEQKNYQADRGKAMKYTNPVMNVLGKVAAVIQDLSKIQCACLDPIDPVGLSETMSAYDLVGV